MARDITQLYCERKGLEFWAEPFNTLSNLIFILAFYYAVRLLIRSKSRDQQLWILAYSIGLMGVGSFIFHAMPSIYTFIGDVTPIALFIILSLWLFLRSSFQCSIRTSIFICAGLISTMLLFRIFGPSDFRIGISVMFIPVIITLYSIGLTYHRKKIIGTHDNTRTHYRALSRIILSAATIFALAVIVRALDTPLCEILPNGLHFIWHILNAGVLYLIFIACYEIKAHRQIKNHT